MKLYFSFQSCNLSSPPHRRSAAEKKAHRPEFVDKHRLTGGNVDGPDIFSQLVADGAGDSQVHPGDHGDFMGGLVVDV